MNILGFYPVIDSIEWLAKLIDWGVKTIQLRIKSHENLESLIKEAIKIGHENKIQLFINDYWQLAIQYQAYGVHLGQEDLNNCDIDALREANILLGISTHDEQELECAQSHSPDYIAFGPIYPTTAKVMRFGPQGLEKLKIWRQKVKCPLVAIGGITLENLNDVLACGVDSVAVISAITQSDNPEYATQQFLKAFSHEPALSETNIIARNWA